MGAETVKIQEIIDFCLMARSQMGRQYQFRTRTLLDMLILELGKDLARSMTQDHIGTDKQD